MKRKTTLIILAIIIVLQCGAMFYWASHKAYYYIDELFTFEYVQNINNHTDSIEYMDDSSLWKVEEWLSVGDLKTRYSLEDGESVFDLPASLTVKKLVLDRNYMWMINALETAIGEYVSPMWICICFNILVWIVFQIVLFIFLTKCLGTDRRTSLLAAALWGFCPLVLGLSVYCRFYSWTLLLFLVVLVLHRLMWDGESHKKNILYEIAAIALMYLAFMNSELLFVIGGSLVFFFTVGLIVRKRYWQSLYYAAPFIGGGLFFIWKRSSLLHVVLHPAQFAAKGSGAASLHASYLLDSTLLEKAVSLLHSVKAFAEYVPGSVVLAIIALLLGLLLYLSVRKKASGLLDGFSLILLASAVVFWLFCGLCGLNSTRYLSFLFLLVFILLTVVFDKLARSYKAPRLVFKVACCLVLISSVLPFYKRDVQYVYEWLKPSLARVSEYRNLDAIVNYDPVHNYNAYYSTSLLSPSSSIYPISQTPSGGELPDLPEAFLYWATYYWSPVEVLDMIKERGYSVELLYDAELALVYYCQKDDRVEE